MKKVYIIRDILYKRILRNGQSVSTPSLQSLPHDFWDSSIVKFDSREEAETFIDNHLKDQAVIIDEVYE